MPSMRLRNNATGYLKPESYVNSSPAVVNGIVYFGSNDGYFYALDAVTGHELWVFKTRMVWNLHRQWRT